MKTIVLTSILLINSLFSFGRDYYEEQRQSWLSKAELNTPAPVVTEKRPVALVEIVHRETAFQGWEARTVFPIDTLYHSSFKSRREVTVDFGEHLTGYFNFEVRILKGTPDAPLRFKCTFGEVPSELATPLDPYSSGMSRAWMQDEVITVMEVPAKIAISRRVAFRYVKIELLGSSSWFDFSLNNLICYAQTSVRNTPAELPATTPAIFKEIDRVGLNTLKECMQTVYEDGPKRDQRLWLGDLYLESLANNYSFRQHDLTRRCLYLLAGVSDPSGFLLATAFERPEPHPQAGQFFLDYALLFGATLRNYYEATHDMEVVDDLWVVAKKQLEIASRYVDADGLMNEEKASKDWTIFFDWKDGLYRGIALQGVVIYALNQTYELAKETGREKEVSELPALIKKMRSAARKAYWDKKTGLFLSAGNKQVSYASQVWMVLAEVVTNREAQQALLALQTEPDVCKPGTPYLYHYYVQALIEAGLNREAKEAVAVYWGGMVKKGADTFWEINDPENEFLSPYRFHPMNSYCHAWSCTPVYFIRKYKEIFQKRN
jgi:hypothetical protein